MCTLYWFGFVADDIFIQNNYSNQRAIILLNCSLKTLCLTGLAFPSGSTSC